MAHTIRWYNEDKTVVLQQYDNDVTKDDLYQLALESAKMLAEHDHTVHLIIDERNSNIVFTSADMAFLEKKVPGNQGVVVLVVRPETLSYKNLVQGMGKRIAPNAFDKTYYAETPEEAKKILQETFGVRFP
jgi:hypothetical protein